MEYSFNINGKVRTFWYNDISCCDGAEDTMEELILDMIHDEQNPDRYIPCRRDENRDLYFIVDDGVKVLCKDAITLTPEELIRKAYEDVEDNHIMKDMMRTMQKYGIGCIRFRVNNNSLQYEGWHVDEFGRGIQQFSTQDRRHKGNHVDYTPAWLEYEAHAEYNRMPQNDYKLHLYAVKDPDSHGTHDFYTSDLNHIWIVRPDYLQLTLGQQGTPTGIYGKQSDSDYLKSLRDNEDRSNMFNA